MDFRDISGGEGGGAGFASTYVDLHASSTERSNNAQESARIVSQYEGFSRSLFWTLFMHEEYGCGVDRCLRSRVPEGRSYV